ncbi:MAG: GWxTD domain-containing protein [Candidatus Aminicenantales bacterium]
MTNRSFPILKITLSTFLISFSLLSLSCRTIILERKLNKENKDFYSKVRYIISEEEKKIFLELPPSEREEFIKEFWKRRDPIPETEENEFKMDYLEKIETANRLFQGGGKPGYIQDRGMIFILLGEPDERYVSPVGKYSEAKSAEVWVYYKKYQISLEFIDHNGDGEYTLEPPSTRALYIINRAQRELRNPELYREELFDFELKIAKKAEKQYSILILLPYEYLWLVDNEGRLEAQLKLVVEIFNQKRELVWEWRKEYQVSLNEEQAAQLTGKKYAINVPFSLEKGIYTMTIYLENKVDGKHQKKKIRFTLS